MRINLQSVYKQINASFLESWREENPRKFLASPKLQEILSYKIILIKKLEALGWVFNFYFRLECQDIPHLVILHKGMQCLMEVMVNILDIQQLQW